MSGVQLDGRSWLTAKAYRLLGYPVPDDVQDDESHRAHSRDCA